jgi:hypothetical protein
VLAHGSRTFVLDHKNLQREQKPDVPGWLTLVAYLGVGGISLVLIFVVGWGLARLESRGGGPPAPEEKPAATARKPAQRRKPKPAPA